MHEHLPAEASPVKIKTATDPWFSLHAAARHLYPLGKDNEVMKSWSCIPETELPNAFIGYRRYYPVRRAWQYVPIYFSHGDATTVQLAQAMAMKIV
jgi:hypothetical protein